MKLLFDQATADEVKDRLSRLTPQSVPQWGRLNVVQMVAHSRAGLEMATGALRPKGGPLPARLLGRYIIKRLAFGNEQPMRRNSPSAPELFALAGGDLTEERRQLNAAIDHFVAKREAACTDYPHPFFGVLTPKEWAELMYKHLDHHLRQFGV